MTTTNECEMRKNIKIHSIFRHADREVVLEHVKSHYRDDGTPQEKQSSSPSTNSAMDLAPPPLPIQMPFQIMNNLLNGHAGTSSTSNSTSSSTSTNVHNRNFLTTLGGGVVNQQTMQAPSNSITSTSLNFNSQNTLTTPTTSTDVVNKNNNGLQENSTSSLKGSFRCGHCGQISNWKHVIQVFTNNYKINNIHNLYLLSSS
jgi:hypothetical protein